MTNKQKTSDEVIAKKYAETCDNESGSFLSHQLEAIRRKAFRAGLAHGRDEAAEKIAEVLGYCEPNTDRMWASRIVSILLNCDFRDSRKALAAYKEKTGGK